jgi:hypothetical protein
MTATISSGGNPFAEAMVKQLRYGASPEVETRSWVAGQMMRAGLDWTTSVLLAVTPGLDWHDVVDALDHGATVDQVARIFL